MIDDIIFSPGRGLPNAPGDFAISVGNSSKAHVLGVSFAHVPLMPRSVMGNMPSKITDQQLAKPDEQAHSSVDRFEHAAKRADVSAGSLALNNSMSVASVGLD